jgi:hypothetical protein
LNASGRATTVTHNLIPEKNPSSPARPRRYVTCAIAVVVLAVAWIWLRPELRKLRQPWIDG